MAIVALRCKGWAKSARACSLRSGLWAGENCLFFKRMHAKEAAFSRCFDARGLVSVGIGP